MKFLKILNTITIVWIVFLFMQFALAGKWWAWNYMSFIPPAFFLFFSFSLVTIYIFGLATKAFNFEKQVLYILPILGLCLLPVIQISDINTHAFSEEPDVEDFDETIKVFTWNSEFWEETDNTAKLFSFLSEQEADIYLIQEYMNRNGVERDPAIAQSLFPDYEINAEGELLTLTRYPIVETFPNGDDEFLRTDINVNGKFISTYNVHIPVHVLRKGERMDDLHEWRIREFNKLESQLKTNENPFIVGGDFNTTHAMGLFRPIEELTTDSTTASDDLFPTTWDIFGMRLWRIDYTLTDTTDRLQPVSYTKVNPEGLSDHWGILVEYGVK